MDPQATFDNLFRNLAADLQSKYSLDEFRFFFWRAILIWLLWEWVAGAEAFDGVLFSYSAASNAFYTKHPQIIRTGTIHNADGSTPSALDRPSKMLFVADIDELT